MGKTADFPPKRHGAIPRRATPPAALALAALLLPSPAEANDSVYTTLDLDACVTLETDPLGGAWQCAGYRGYGILFQEGDLRQSVFAGHIGEWYREGAFESFGQFNDIGSTIEWRLDDSGRPIAIIVRFRVDYAVRDLTSSTGEVLTIIRVGQPGLPWSCVVGYVDARANPDANILARQVADSEAVSFACGYAEPFYHGAVGDRPGDPFRSYPAGLE